MLPTYYIAESLPNSIIEYLFCAKPVITTNIGAITEMISLNEQIAGSSINLHDGIVNIGSIVNAIENYICNPLLVENHAEVAIRAAEKFTMNSCIVKYLNAYLDVPLVIN